MLTFDSAWIRFYTLLLLHFSQAYSFRRVRCRFVITDRINNACSKHRCIFDCYNEIRLKKFFCPLNAIYPMLFSTT